MRFIPCPVGETTKLGRAWGVAVVYCQPDQANPSFISFFGGTDAITIRSAFERRPDSGMPWTDVRVTNNGTISIVVATVDFDGEELPRVAPLWSDVTLRASDGVALAVSANHVLEVQGLGGGPLEVSGTEGPFIQNNNSGGLEVEQIDNDGRSLEFVDGVSGKARQVVKAYGAVGALAQDTLASNALLVTPTPVVIQLATGTLTTAVNQNSAVFDVSGYSALMATLTGATFTGGTSPLVTLSVDMIAPDGTTLLFRFAHTTGIASGVASVQIGRGLATAAFDSATAAYGARPLQARAHLGVTGLPATAGGTWTFLGIRGEG